MLKSVIVGAIGGMLSVIPAIAQTPVQPSDPQTLSQTLAPRGASETISPLEIQQFAQALKQLRRVEMETQAKMAEVLKDENLSPQRFQEIGQRRDNPNFPVSDEITPSEQERFDKALAKIQTIQEESIPKQRRAITLQGLTVERFSQIGRAVDSNPALRQQVQNSF